MRIFKAVSRLGRAPEILRCAAVTPHWPRLTAAYLGLPVKLPLQIKLSTGTFGFTTLADIRTFWSVFFAGTYEVRPTDTVIVDAGANIGTFTLYALLHAPHAKVIAIEPAPDSCERLRGVLYDHGFSHRCLINQAALGREAGSTSIDLRPESQFRSTGTGSTLVPVMTLDELLHGSEVDLLKLDIEGSEYAAIGPHSFDCLQRVDRIAMEYHPNGSLADLVPQLASAGLTCVSARDDGDGYGIATFCRAGIVRNTV